MMPTDFPVTVQIETQSGCNANCIMCPYGTSTDKLPKGKMKWGLFKKIIDECANYRPRDILLFLSNEPLLDKDIIKCINYAKEKNPNSKIDISTNASLLTKEKADELINSKLDSINISFQGINKADYESVMKGLNFENTLNNINYFIDLVNKSPKKISITISMKSIGISQDSINRAANYWQSKGVRFFVGLLENRAGNVENFSQLAKEEYFAAPFCKRVFDYMGILPNGEVVLCCEDWKKEQILGNANNSSLYEIWHNKTYQEIRRKFDEKRFSELALCKNCKIDKKLDKGNTFT